MCFYDLYFPMVGGRGKTEQLAIMTSRFQDLIEPKMLALAIALWLSCCVSPPVELR